MIEIVFKMLDLRVEAEVGRVLVVVEAIQVLHRRDRRLRLHVLLQKTTKRRIRRLPVRLPVTPIRFQLSPLARSSSHSTRVILVCLRQSTPILSIHRLNSKIIGFYFKSNFFVMFSLNIFIY